MAPYLTTLLSRQSVGDGIIAGQVLRILCLAMFCWYFGSLYENILLVGSNYKGLLRSISIAVVINLCLNFILIPFYSYYAAASTTVFTEIIDLVITLVYVYKITGFKAKLTGFSQIIISSVVMAGALFVIQHFFASDIYTYGTASRFHQLLVLIAMTLAGSAAYLVAMLLWGKNSPLYYFISILKKSDV